MKRLVFVTLVVAVLSVFAAPFSTTAKAKSPALITEFLRNEDHCWDGYGLVFTVEIYNEKSKFLGSEFDVATFTDSQKSDLSLCVAQNQIDKEVAVRVITWIGGKKSVDIYLPSQEITYYFGKRTDVPYDSLIPFQNELPNVDVQYQTEGLIQSALWTNHALFVQTAEPEDYATINAVEITAKRPNVQGILRLWFEDTAANDGKLLPYDIGFTTVPQNGQYVPSLKGVYLLNPTGVEIDKQYGITPEFENIVSMQNKWRSGLTLKAIEIDAEHIEDFTLTPRTTNVSQDWPSIFDINVMMGEPNLTNKQ